MHTRAAASAGFSRRRRRASRHRSERAADCPDEAALAAATLALGARPVAPPAHVLTANVELDRDDAGYVARIATLGRKTGTREIRAPGETCAELVELTSVALAILFDLLPPEAPDSPPLGAPTSSPPKPVPRPQKPAATRSPTAESKPNAEERFGSATLYGAAAYGLLGDVLTGETGGALYVPLSGAIEVGAGGFWAPGRTIPYEPGTVSVSLAAARLELAGWLASFGALALGARIELGIGALHPHRSENDPGRIRARAQHAASREHAKRHSGTSDRTPPSRLTPELPAARRRARNHAPPRSRRPRFPARHKTRPPPRRAHSPTRPHSRRARSKAVESPERALLRSGKAGDALDALWAIGGEFPRGALVQEREALVIEALLATGRRDEARERARQFLKRYPTSPHAEGARRAAE